MKRHLICVLGALVLAASPAFAATYVWNGSVSDRFSDAANWSGGNPASDSRAELVFPATAARKTLTNDLPSLTVQAMSFTGNGYTIGGLPIRLANATVGDPSSGPTTIACELILRGNATFAAVGDFHEGLILNGPISGTGDVTKAGSGPVIFGGITANTYSGTTRVAGGELRLAKHHVVTAIPGPLAIDAEVLVLAAEQIANEAPVTITSEGVLRLPHDEIIGPLTLERGATISMSADRSAPILYTGALFLGGDIRLTASASFRGPATIMGAAFLPETRTITIDPDDSGSLFIADLRGAPGAGVILRRGDGSGTAPVEIVGSYPGPTLVEGPEVAIANPDTDVTVRSGTFNGDVRSVTADGGTIGSLEAAGELRLGSGATVALTLADGRVPFLFANGIRLGNPTLALTIDPELVHRPGITYVVIANEGTAPTDGTFAGMPEGTILLNRFRISYTGGTGNDVTLTDVARYFSQTYLSIGGELVTGATIELVANVDHDRNAGAATGSVTFRTGDTLIATVPLDANGEARTTFVATTPGTYAITARYEGNAVLGPSEVTQSVVIAQRAAEITSVEPAEVHSGETVLLVVRGTDFREDSYIVVASRALTPSFYSPTELRAAFTVPSTSTAGDASVRVYSDDGPSNDFPIRIIGGPATPATLTFDERAIRGPVAPGASSAWLRGALRRMNFMTRVETEYAIVRDADNDGTVLWNLADTIPANTLAVMVDLQNGTIHAGRPGEGVPDPLPFPVTFLRDPAGAYSHMLIEGSPYAMLWVRPGVGAWRLEISDGAPRDLYPAFGGILTSASFMQPVGDSPAAPAGFERGDVLAGLYDVNASWFGARVDDYLMTGPGSFSLREDWYAYEDEGTTTIPVLRSGGSDGVATVNYATAGGTAIAGVHYRATAGTLTFGAGELLKLIEIPLIDDTTFGHDTTFTLVLTDPAGATIASPGASRIELLEDDEPPTLSLGDDLRIDEGDTGTRQVMIPVTLTGSTRVPIHAEWSMYGEDESFTRGLLVFAPGETRKTITVTIQGDTLTEPDGRIVIYLGPDFDAEIFPPIDRNRADIIIVDDDQLPRLTILDASAGEPEGFARLHILVTGRSTRPILLQYTTVSGTAVAGADFIAKTETIDVPPHGGRVDVVLADDGAPEAPEWFSVVLSDAENATLLRTSALVTVTDDDTASVPALSITGPSVREGDSGSTSATFSVQLSAASQSRVLVNWRTEDGTAGSTDYVASAGTLTFEAGETVKTINVDVFGDTATELDEMFTVRLSSPTNATLRNNIGTATIRNDDVSRHRAAPH